jgi:hypothetical protein
MRICVKKKLKRGQTWMAGLMKQKKWVNDLELIGKYLVLNILFCSNNLYKMDP